MDQQDDGRLNRPGQQNNRDDRAFGEASPVERVTDWDHVTRRYRRGLGGWWWLALLAVPALLAALGLGLTQKADNVTGTLPSGVATPSGGDTGSGTATDSAAPSDTSASSDAGSTSSSAAPTGSANAAPSPFSLDRAGDALTVTAKVPDDAAKTALLTAVKTAAPGATITDKVTVEAGSVAPSAAALGPVLEAASKAGDYGVSWDGAKATLKGIAPSEAEKSAVESAVKTAWPAAQIDNQITVGSGGASAAGCDNLGTDINAILAKSKLTFANNGSQLTSQSTTVVTSIATKAKACPNAKLAVTGHTDNSGTDAINNPLSTRRAQAVRQVLVSNGVAAANVTATGKGSSEPKTSNDTAAGRDDNRRVEISVS